LKVTLSILVQGEIDDILTFIEEMEAAQTMDKDKKQQLLRQVDEYMREIAKK